jgi:predicted porin
LYGIGIDCHGDPLNVVKYTTPTFAGFTVSASWGEDDFYDVAVKYAGEFGEFKVGAAAGYSEWNNGDLLLGGGPSQSELFEAGASVMHVPTGIFVSASYSHYEQEAGGVQTLENDAWYIKAGIKQKWNSLGATAIYGEYANYGEGYDAFDPTDASDVDRYGVGIHQWIDAAAMQVYFNWTHLEVNGTPAGAAFADGDELDTFTFGGVIFF